MYLIDTNIFLEILLEQAKKDVCKAFLTQYADHSHISDFSLHSIGVILFRHRRQDIFKAFTRDILPIIRIKTLSKAQYAILPNESLRTGLDFDDVYQFLIGREQGFAIVTMDQDFQKIQAEHLITFL